MFWLRNFFVACFVFLFLGVSFATNTGGVCTSEMVIPKVNLAKVRAVWVALHNAERATKSLAPLIYSPQLESTAFNWSTHLAAINRTTHKRKNSDPYYSYFGIKQWFIDQ